MKMLRSFWKVGFWLVAITVLSCMPAHDFIKPSFLNIPNLDKFVHFLMYSIFSYLLIQGLLRQIPTGKHEFLIIIAFVISSIYGLLMEIAQLWIFTSREADILDMAFNITGAIAGIIIFENIFLTGKKNRF